VSELSAKDARVTALEKSVQSLNQEKSRLFEQLQMRQAEYESSQTELESMQGETTEINYQLREANDRIALLTDELAEAHRSRHVKSASSTPSADESARVLAITEAKYETRLAELRARVQSAEKDRNDGEAAWSRKLDEKTREVDDIRRQIDASAHIDQRHEAIVAQIRQENEELQAELRAQRKEMVDLQLRAQQAIEAEVRSIDPSAWRNYVHLV
jgi:predicted nuclease with TOPRIM domain